jgi:hypothetical protein
MPVIDRRRQFTPQHICLALDALEHEGWLRMPEPATPV